MLKIDWDLTLKLIGIVFTAVGGLYQWRNLRFRAKLKDDLEILKLYGAYGADNPNYIALKKHIDQTIAKAYPHPANEPKKMDRIGIGLGLFNLVTGLSLILLSIIIGLTWPRIVLIFSAIFVGSFLLLTSSGKSSSRV